MKASPFEDDRDVVPNPAKPEAPSTAPTPEPETPKDARQYRPLPPARTSAVKPRATTLPKQPAASPRRPTVPASVEQEIAPPAKAPRTLTVRPAEAKRLAPASEEFDEEEPVIVRASIVQPTSSRVPANPLRSR
jgi:hypothetical protein